MFLNAENRGCVEQDRPNTEVEERLLTPNGDSGLRPGFAPTDTEFPGQVTLSIRAGTAVPFDARGIHRGLKPKGDDRKSLFVVRQLQSHQADTFDDLSCGSPNLLFLLLLRCPSPLVSSSALGSCMQ